MILPRFAVTCLFISATRVCPAASAAVMSARVACRWAWCWGRNSGVVTNIGHVRRVMVEDLLHHVLGDVPVEQGCSQRVAPLMRGQVHGLAVLVADVASFQ